MYYYNPGVYANSQTVTTVKKVDSQAQLVWQLTISSPMQIKSVATTDDGAVYMGGTCSGNFVFNNMNFTGIGKTDIWIAKYNSSNNFVWMKILGSKQDDFLGEICKRGNNIAFTGSAGDTIDIMGTLVPKAKTSDFFVATATSSGSFQAVKFSAPDSLYQMVPDAAGMECAGDAAGNVYVYGIFTGRGTHGIDTFHVGYQSDNTVYSTHAVMKFNASLQLQYVKPLTTCMYDMQCYRFYDLTVTAGGDAYLVKLNSYGGSGSDILRSTIMRFNTAGVQTNTFEPRPDKKNYVGDIDLDNCGNVYYTGLCRNYIESPVVTMTMLNGQLSPSLTSNWLRCDSTVKDLYGAAISVLSPNDVFVAGFFIDTITLATTMSSSKYSGFFAELKNAASSDCEITTGVRSITQRGKLAAYPNPCADVLTLNTEEAGTGIRLYSQYGRLELQQSCVSETTTLDTSALPEGIYLLQLYRSSGVVTTKVVVRR